MSLLAPQLRALGGVDREGRRRTRARLALACAAVLSLAGCAKIEAPSGGPPDTTAPRIVDSSPDSGAVGVRPDTIRIRFSEPMDKRSVRDALRILPAMDVASLRWQESTFEIALAQQPDTGTTYAIFLSGARDRQGNALGTATVPFATGAALARGVVEGRVLTGRIKAEGVLVFAWQWNGSEDPDAASDPGPLAMALTEKEGRFRLAHLPERVPLRVCALFDARGDRGFDPEDDLWGCPEEPVVLPDTLPELRDLSFYLVFDDEPGSVRGVAADSACLEVRERGEALTHEADSLYALVRRVRAATADTLAMDSLLGFAAERPPTVVDTADVLRRIARVDSTLLSWKSDSAACGVPLIVRIFVSDTSLVAEVRGEGEFEFRDLEPGVYTIRAFRDANGNGQADPEEASGSYPYPIDLLPGRRLTDLAFPVVAAD